MQWNRTDRLAESIRQEVAEIVEYELTDERITGVSVVSVKVSEDLRNATIFVNFASDEKIEIKAAMAALRHAAGFVRHHLALRLQLKRTPELLFQYDDTPKRAARIEQLLGEERERGQET